MRLSHFTSTSWSHGNAAFPVFSQNPSSQALGVEVVDLGASVRRHASLATGPVLAAALAPVGNGRIGGIGGSGGIGGTGRAVGRADGAELDVGEGNGGVGNILLEVRGDTGSGRARAAGGAKLGRAGRVGRVEPEHVRVVL